MNAKEIVKQVRRAERIGNSLNAAGITMKLVEKRDYYNLQFRCGRLHDGKVRVSYRIEVSGNTYPVRAILKQNGYRWDPKSKVWWAKPAASMMNGTGAAILRALAN